MKLLYKRTSYTRHRQSRRSLALVFKTAFFSTSMITTSILPFAVFGQALILDDFLDGAEVMHKLPIFSQQVSFNLPKGWKLAFNEEGAGMYAAEFVPANQELRAWSSMFCVQGFEGLSEAIEPEEFLDSLATAYRETCDGEVIYTKLGENEVDGHEGFSAILGCTRMPDTHHATRLTVTGLTSVPQGEIGHYTAISGGEDLYLLHQSKRGDVFSADKPPLESLNHKAFIAAISPLRLSR